MSIGVFSDIRASVPMNAYAFKNNTPVTKNPEPVVVQSTTDTKDKLKVIAPIAISLLAIPITAGITYKLANKNMSGLKDQIKTLTTEVANLKALNEKNASEIAKNLKNHTLNNRKANAQIWSILIGAAGLTGTYQAGKLSQKDKENIGLGINSRITRTESAANSALNEVQQSTALNANSLAKKYTKNLFGIQLLQNSDSISKDAQKYSHAIEQIKTAAPKRLYESPNIMPITKEHPTLWTVTSEFAPIKEGGLGSVPVEIQNNVTKLGINIPAFIPMYQQKGIATLRQEGNKYIYTYNTKEFNLKKAATFKLDTYQAGKSKTEEVEIFVSDSKDKDGNNKQLIFIKNDNYFNGTIYQPTEKTEEPEKFAFFSKAVYELAKAKYDIKSIKDLNITDKKAFESIKEPDAFILNDWQASPIAALARYKAPMENAYKQLSDDAAKKLSEMTIITIGHNTMYQGSTRNNNNDAQRKEATTNILNTYLIILHMTL